MTLKPQSQLLASKILDKDTTLESATVTLIRNSKVLRIETVGLKGIPLIKSPQKQSVVNCSPSSSDLWENATQSCTLATSCIISLNQDRRKLPCIDHIHTGWPLQNSHNNSFENEDYNRNACASSQRIPISETIIHTQQCQYSLFNAVFRIRVLEQNF
jgi:hypothetical protein